MLLFAGDRCNQCADNYYGNPLVPGDTETCYCLQATAVTNALTTTTVTRWCRAACVSRVSVTTTLTRCCRAAVTSRRAAASAASTTARASTASTAWPATLGTRRSRTASVRPTPHTGPPPDGGRRLRGA